MDALIVAPADPARWGAWRERLRRWREEVRAARGDEDAYRLAPFAWAARCLTTHKILLWDERFYERARHRYRVAEYVSAFEARFGALDGVLLWHAYPNLGFDERNQFDFWRAMPGGLAGLREVVDALHEREVRVMLPYCPWDRATRDEGCPDAEALAKLVEATDADGIYLDTLARSAVPDLRIALDSVKAGVVLQSQHPPPLDGLDQHHMSWAEGADDGPAPGVLRNRWVEPRHMVHVVRRWMRERHGELHTAWMNGAGVMVWENVFGSWMGWSDRDATTMRLMSAVQHHCHAIFRDGDWTPLAFAAGGVHASRWECAGARLTTLVNREDAWRREVAIEVRPGLQCLDLVAGRRAHVSSARGVSRALVDLPPGGLGALLETDALTPADEAFMERQRHEWGALPGARSTARTRRVHRLGNVPATAPRPASPPGMAGFAGGAYRRRVTFRRRECGIYEGADFGGWPGNAPPGLHETAEIVEATRLAPYAIDIAPVSNADFHRFLQESGYRPGARHNLLRHWEENTRPPSGREHEPVVWIGLDDARAYTAWAGKRLPSEAEWQWAAEQGRLNPGSPAVWNWTESERSDGRTRFCILKGGSAFRAEGSDWYADGGPHPPDFAAKYLLLWSGLDRCATIGFRCAVSLDACNETL